MTILDSSLSTSPRIDWTLLDEVQERLQEWIRTSEELEATIPTDAIGTSIPSSWQSVDSQLTAWQERLADLTHKTRDIEEELTAQEKALRGWYDSLEAQKRLLTSPTL